MPSVVDYNDALVWAATYPGKIQTIDWDAQWQGFSAASDVLTSPNHGATENQYIIFRNQSLPMFVEGATYRAANVTTDTLQVALNAPGFPVVTGIPDSLTGEISRSRYQETVTYGPDFYSGHPGGIGGYFSDRWANLVSVVPGIQTTDRILVGGAALGWLCWAAHQAGYASCWGLDYSTWIQAQDPSAFAPGVTVVEGDLVGSGQVRQKLRAATGDDEFDWIITEDVFTSYQPTDGDFDQLMVGCEQGLYTTASDLSRAVHLVSVGSFSTWAPFVSMTLAEWKATRPAHTWVSLRDWSVL